MTELLKVRMSDLLGQVAIRFPEHEALVDVPRGERFTYVEFLSRVNRLSKGLLKLGVRKGDHLCLWAPNRSEWIITEFAIAKIGGVLVSVDTNAQLHQLEYVLRQSDAKYLLMTEGLKGKEYIEIIQQLPKGGSGFPDLPELKSIILISDHTYPGMLNWKDVLEMGKDIPDSVLAERQRFCHCDDVVTLLYTSGTTGAPKGVMSTHFGIINTSVASAEIQKLTEKDRLCVSVPLHHMFGVFASRWRG